MPVSGHGGVPHVGEMIAGIATTVKFAEPTSPPSAQEIVVEPPATPDASPVAALIVATLGVELDHAPFNPFANEHAGTLDEPSCNTVVAENCRVLPTNTVLAPATLIDATGFGAALICVKLVCPIAQAEHSISSASEISFRMDYFAATVQFVPSQ